MKNQNRALFLSFQSVRKNIRLLYFFLLFCVPFLRTDFLKSQSLPKTTLSLAKKTQKNKGKPSLKKQEDVKITVQGDVASIASPLVSSGRPMNYSAGAIESV